MVTENKFHSRLFFFSEILYFLIKYGMFQTSGSETYDASVTMVTIVCILYSSLKDWWGLNVLIDSCVFNILTPQISSYSILYQMSTLIT